MEIAEEIQKADLSLIPLQVFVYVDCLFQSS